MATSKCMYCGSAAIGRGCPYGPKNVHVHPMNAGKCIYCGSQAVGRGCSINPTGDMHIHGVDYNNMIKEALHNGITVGLLMRKLSLPFTEWPAYKLGIINEKGVQIKKPESIDEKSAYSNNDAYIAKLKRMLTEGQIQLINSSIYISNKKEQITNSRLYTEKYTQEIELQNQINVIIEQLVKIVSNSYSLGFDSADVEKMIIESINKH